MHSPVHGYPGSRIPHRRSSYPCMATAHFMKPGAAAFVWSSARVAVTAPPEGYIYAATRTNNPETNS